MGAQEDSPVKRKEFQKRTDEDIDSFLAKKDFSKSTTPSYTSPAQPVPAAKIAEPEKKPAPVQEAKEPTEDEHEDQIRAARTSRAEHEAYHDVALLRKKSHAYGHKAAKFFHKHKASEAKAQKCSAKAVAFREKAAARREKAKDFMDRAKSYEAELSSAAKGSTELSPESLRTRVASMERKAAKEEELARKNESKAATQTEKSAKFKTKSAKYLEQNKINESESRRYSKRADNLERAGP